MTAGYGGGEQKDAGSIEEFRALRAEIDRRSTAQQAIVGLQLTASATIVGTAAAHPSVSVILFVLGPLSFFLALAWTDHHAGIHLLARYIRERIEPRFPGMGWQGWYREKGRQRKLDLIMRVVVPNVLVFAGPSAGALAVLAAATTVQPTTGVVAWAVDVTLTLFAAGLIAWRTWPRDLPQAAHCDLNLDVCGSSWTTCLELENGWGCKAPGVRIPVPPLL